MTSGSTFLLLLGGICLLPERADLHSLRYYFSFLSEPLPGVPQYSVVGYVDDVPIIGYTSDGHRAGPRAPWMENITDEDPRYWEEIKETFEEVRKKLSDSLRNLMEIKNQPLGLHVFQAMLGCELHNDGSVKWFERYAYDGSNYTAKNNPAAVTEDRGNSKQSFECIEAVKKLLKYGEESLRRRVAPQTMVTRRKNGDCTFLTGYAYGFYPRPIEVKWVRDGVEIPWESSEILPQPDGTYQVRTTVKVQDGDDEKMDRYEVYHSSLPDTVTVMYEEKSAPMGVIIGGVIGALVGVGLLAAVVWFVYSKMKKSGMLQLREEQEPSLGSGSPGLGGNQDGGMLQPREEHEASLGSRSPGLGGNKDGGTLVVGGDAQLLYTGHFRTWPPWRRDRSSRRTASTLLPSWIRCASWNLPCYNIDHPHLQSHPC